MPLPDFSKLNILVIGDVMLDHYIWGDALRISPEAPVPVVGVERDSFVPGGAANVACNLAGLGVQTTLLGRYGPDDGGNRLGALLSERGIHLSPQGCRAKTATIVKTRVVVQRQQMCRIDREMGPDAYNLSHELKEDAWAGLLEDVDAVVLSDYAKGAIDDTLLQGLRAGIDRCARKPLLIVDPKPRRELGLEGVDLMTPNRTEALQLAGLPSDPAAAFDDEEVCAAIHRRYAPAALVVTLGAEGMLLCRDGTFAGRIPTEAREVFDVSGAGDTVVSVLAAAFAVGLPLEEAAGLANIAAGIVVSHVGTSPIGLGELQALVEP